MRKYWFFGLLGLGILFVLPFIIPRFWIYLITEILILGLAGMSVNFLLGYGGSLPFGHAAFYAIGAYGVAILLRKTGIPSVAVLIIAPLIAATMGAVFGLLVARLYRFYYAIMTAAFSMLVWNIICKWTSLTGGHNGIAGVELTGILSSLNSTINRTYFFVLIVFLSCITVLRIIINSPFGWTLRAIRENSERVSFVGVNIFAHRYLAFVISSFFAGIAGVLSIISSRNIFPDYAYWLKSADMFMVCILGGMFSFFGPLIGAAILILLQTFVTSVTQYLHLVIGIIICVVVLLMPDGVMGIWERLQSYVNVKGALPHTGRGSTENESLK